MSDSDSSHDSLKSLYKEVGIDQGASLRGTLKESVSGISNLPADKFLEIGLEASLCSALSGDWQTALELVLRFCELNKTHEPAVQLWRLRCLIEMQRYAEALAVVENQDWGAAKFRSHVDFLAAKAFSELGMHEKARARLNAAQKDPYYSRIADISLKH